MKFMDTAYMHHFLGREKFGPIKGEVILSQVHWHRVVCDEFHELGNNLRLSKATNFFLEELSSSFYIGVTGMHIMIAGVRKQLPATIGTPQYKTASDISDMAKYLKTELPEDGLACHLFLQNMVRRNEPNLQLPPLTQRVIKVELSPQERGLNHGFESLSVEALMSCNHHQLANEILEIVGDQKEMTVDEVAVAVQEKRWKQIEELTAAIARIETVITKCRSEIDDWKGQITAGSVDKTEAECKRCLSVAESKLRMALQDLSAKRNKLASLRSQFNFFQAVLNALRADQEQNCLICLETIAKEEDFVIARCGHIHCVGCMEMLLARNPCCSLCRTPMQRHDVMRMKLPKYAKAGEDKQDDLEDDRYFKKYGSKLAAFVRFLRETLRERPDAKLILFIQFRRLMQLVSNALHEFEVEHVRCDGNVFTKTKAVTGFKTSPEVRLILLSSEESVSGLHLTEATHVVILHPFYLGDDALAMAYEKQGIARAWRGGLDHPVEVVRFIAQGTMEETLANRRGYGDNKEGAGGVQEANSVEEP